MSKKHPVIHDRHVVGMVFDWMKENDVNHKRFKKPDNLTILTCRNKGEMKRATLFPDLAEYTVVSILEQNLEYLGIEGMVVLSEDFEGPWRCTYKIQWIHDYLQSGKCDTELFMFCDAVDVIFQDDPQVIIDIFNTFECDALFMSTHGVDGYQCMPQVKEKIDEINGGTGRYLNSGVYIGKTEFIAELFKNMIQYIGPNDVTFEEYYDYLANDPSNYPHGSQDQDIFRFIEPQYYPRLRVDYKNIMAYRTPGGPPSGYGLQRNMGNDE